MSADQLSADIARVEAAVWTVLGNEPTTKVGRAAEFDAIKLTEAVTIYRRAGRAALEQAANDAWQHLYIQFTDWTRAEEVFIEHVLPTLLRLQAMERIRSWWFLRNHPCWRLRLLTPPGTSLPQELVGVLNEATQHHHLTNWRTGIYEPETAAFGGPDTMNTVHELFAADSIATLTIKPNFKHFEPRELSILLITTMAQAAGPEWYEQGDLWLRRDRLQNDSSHSRVAAQEGSAPRERG